MKKGLFFIYGLICYLAFLAAFVWGIAFTGGFVPATLWAAAVPPVYALLIDLALLALFGVQHSTDFEQGFPLQFARSGGGWEPDTWLWDDQAIVCHVKKKGLVVVSGCSHAGVINVLRHAQRLTGISAVYAFIGGMHLSGGLFESIIPRTIIELAAIGPAVVVPGHCTGWRATHEIVRAMPEAYVQSSVGTRLHFA